ncbi:vitamin K epoxide reductase [Jonesia denitrificans]|nr:vitamin K epoxide reductase [Jonesia denitrificans]
MTKDEGHLDDPTDGQYVLYGRRHSNQRIFTKMLIAALLSLVAAFVLAVEALHLAEDPTASLACDVNAVLSCGTVAQSWQAEAFGFPNVFLGLMFESAAIMMALIGLSGVRIPRWLAIAEQVIYTFALLFALWLFSQSMWVIGALCPWCMLITYSTGFIFLSMLHYNIRERNLWRSGRGAKIAHAFVQRDIDLYVGIGYVALITVLVVAKYGPQLVA